MTQDCHSIIPEKVESDPKLLSETMRAYHSGIDALAEEKNSFDKGSARKTQINR